MRGALERGDPFSGSPQGVTTRVVAAMSFRNLLRGQTPKHHLCPSVTAHTVELEIRHFLEATPSKNLKVGRQMNSWGTLQRFLFSWRGNCFLINFDKIGILSHFFLDDSKQSFASIHVSKSYYCNIYGFYHFFFWVRALKKSNHFVLKVKAFSF